LSFISQKTSKNIKAKFDGFISEDNMFTEFS